MTLAWLHDLGPIAFHLGPLAIRWYGLSYAAGFVIAWLVLRWLARRGAGLIPEARVGDAILCAVVGVVVGGRLGYVLFYQPDLLWSVSGDFPWWGVLRVHEGGMASHGGMAGVIVAAWVISRGWSDGRGGRMGRAPLLHVLDLMCLVAPFGLFLGRIANFINGELLGRIVARPGAAAPWWAVRYPQELIEGYACERTPDQERLLGQLAEPFRPMGGDRIDAFRALITRVQAGDRELARRLEPLISARHPSQLYQAVAEGVVVGLVVWILARRPRRPGVVGCAFLISYGVLRVATEFWRLPDAHLAHQRPLGLSRGQWLSVLMVAVGLGVLGWIGRSGAGRIGGWGRRRIPAGRGDGGTVARSDR